MALEQHRQDIDFLSKAPRHQPLTRRSTSTSTWGTLSTTKSTRVLAQGRCLTERLARIASWTDEESNFNFILWTTIETAPRMRLDNNELYLEHQHVRSGLFVTSTATSRAALTLWRRSTGWTSPCSHSCSYTSTMLPQSSTTLQQHINNFNGSVTTASTFFFVFPTLNYGFAVTPIMWKQ